MKDNNDVSETTKAANITTFTIKMNDAPSTINTCMSDVRPHAHIRMIGQYGSHHATHTYRIELEIDIGSTMYDLNRNKEGKKGTDDSPYMCHAMQRKQRHKRGIMFM